jgi:hypothetical protein
MPKNVLLLTASPFALACAALAANARRTGGPFVEPSDHPSVTQQQLVTEGQAKRRDFIALLGGAAASRSGRTDNRGEESWSA